MNFKRTIPPVAAPISLTEFLSGLRGLSGKKGVDSLTEELKSYFSVDHIFLTNSGKAGLYVILSALKSLGRRRKVIVPSYTCFSVPSAVLLAGLDLEVCDIDLDTLDYNFSLLEEKIDEKTLCIVQNHLFGIPADLNRTKELIKGRGIFLVEDGAQAMGARCGEELAGTMGDVGFFSLGRGKPITSGTGGVILTGSGEIGKAVEEAYGSVRDEPLLSTLMNLFAVKMMLFFLHPSLYWIPAGLPFLGLGETRFYESFDVYRFEGSRAGLLKNWREKLERFHRGRVEKANYIGERLKPLFPSTDRLKNIPCLRYPLILKSGAHKDEVCRRAKEEGLGISPMYPSSLGALKELRNFVDLKECRVGERAAERLVTLPTHTLQREGDIEAHCALVEKVYKEMA